jgi:hypothetical protein
MASSKALADAFLNWLKGSAFLAAPETNLFLSLHTEAPGPAGTAGDVSTAVLGGRATVSMAALGANSSAAEGGRQASNNTTLTLTGDAQVDALISHVGIWSAASGGTFYVGGALPTSVQVLAGDIVRIPVGGLRFVVPGYQ